MSVGAWTLARLTELRQPVPEWIEAGASAVIVGAGRRTRYEEPGVYCGSALAGVFLLRACSAQSVTIVTSNSRVPTP